MISPQKGKQELFLAKSEFIGIYGGAAGGGKTYALLIDPLRYLLTDPYFRGVIFRSTRPQIVSPGGLLDASTQLYTAFGATYKQSPEIVWKFPNGATLQFASMEQEKDKYKWQGSEMTFIGFDELTHFSLTQFFYMLSRARSAKSTTKPYIRATCNPDADSWVRGVIEPWLNEDGYANETQCGKRRFLEFRENDVRVTDIRESEDAKTISFVSSNLADNKILTDNNPEYARNLRTLPTVERERLLYGNWNIKPKAGLYYKREQLTDILQTPPLKRNFACTVRGWDLAATADKDAAATAGVLMGRLNDGHFVILDVINVRRNASDVKNLIRLTAQADRAKYGNVIVRIPQDPGQAGKAQAEDFRKTLTGFPIFARPELGDKVSRAVPFAAQWQGGNVSLVAGDWNNVYIEQMENFPDGKFKDMVDATSSAYDELTNYSTSPLNSRGLLG